MKLHHVFISITLTVIMLNFCLNVSAKQDSTEIQNTSKNKQVVERYFHEVDLPPRVVPAFKLVFEQFVCLVLCL